MSDARDYLYHSMAPSVCTEGAMELRAGGWLVRWTERGVAHEVKHNDEFWARRVARAVKAFADMGSVVVLERM